MQQRCGDLVISLKRVPGKATGSLLGPRVYQRKLPPNHHQHLQISTQIKHTDDITVSPSLKKKTSQWSSLISMCSVAGSENNNALSLSHWLSYLVETTKPQAAAKLNNSQKEDGHSITIRGSLFCILPMPRGSQAVISAKDVWKFKLLEKSVESLWRFQIEECGQRWLWVKVDQGKWKWIKSCFFPFLFFLDKECLLVCSKVRERT